MKVPVVFIKEKGSKMDDTFVVFKLGELKELWESYK